MESAPVLEVTPLDADRDACSGDLVASWRLTNLGDAPIQILETWLPHGRFLAERRAIDPPLELQPGAACTIQRTVRHSAARGEAVENAFLDLRLRSSPELDKTWRVLARMSVRTAASGLVTLAVEAVTSHQEGFAESGRLRRNG